MNRLADETWTDADVAGPRVVLVPLGSCEQHGPHLPLDTDTRIAVAIADAAAARVDGVVVAPALSYGSSGEHAGFTGTLSIGQDALELVLIELVRSADRFSTVVLVNGHGGNLEPVRRAERQLRRDGRSARSWFPVIPGGDAHAGRTETSLMLAIDPSVVRLERAVAGNTAPLHALLADLQLVGVVGVSPTGVLGDPTGANADEGRAMLDHLVDELVATLAH